MDGRNPREKKILKEDLTERLISQGRVIPENPVRISKVRRWAMEEEEERINELLNELVSEADSIEYYEKEQKCIGIVDLESAREYLDNIQQTPWFEV